MKKRILSLILLITFTVSSLSACSQSTKQTAERFDCFDTYSALTIYCTNKEFEIYKAEFDVMTEKYHKLFDIYNLYDGTVNLKTLNDRAALSPVTVSDELFDALVLAKKLYNITYGKCNVAIGSVTSIWHDARTLSIKSPNKAYIPSQEEINEALLHTDINNLILDEETKSVLYSDPKLLLDFGAIAKGYVASLLYKRLIAIDCKNFLINLGGNVVSYGTKVQNEPWLVKIENPFDNKNSGYNEAIELNDSTLVTSGSYQRYYTYNEKKYSHIIDSVNGYPADLFTSVSIQAPADSSALADALSTALFCMSYEDGFSLVDKLENVEALWIFNDGSIKSTSNFGGGK